MTFQKQIDPYSCNVDTIKMQRFSLILSLDKQII